MTINGFKVDPKSSQQSCPSLFTSVNSSSTLCNLTCWRSWLVCWRSWLVCWCQACSLVCWRSWLVCGSWAWPFSWCTSLSSLLCSEKRAAASWCLMWHHMTYIQSGCSFPGFFCTQILTVRLVEFQGCAAILGREDSTAYTSNPSALWVGDCKTMAKSLLAWMP